MARLIVVLFSMTFMASASRAASPSGEPCAGAAAWSRSHTAAASSSSASNAPADLKLLEDLKVRVERDQSARRDWLANPRSEPLARAVGAIDADNVAWLKELVARNGFPTASQAGTEGVHLAWVLLQHADRDPQFQAGLLPILAQRHAAGELPANDLARMTDRILIASGKPQRYGTQFDWFSGSFQMPDATTLRTIDVERERLGLMPLQDYVCTIRSERENVLRRANAN